MTNEKLQEWENKLINASSDIRKLGVIKEMFRSGDAFDFSDEFIRDNILKTLSICGEDNVHADKTPRLIQCLIVNHIQMSRALEENSKIINATIKEHEVTVKQFEETVRRISWQTTWIGVTSALLAFLSLALVILLKTTT